jgi:site-specific recombinase XerC
VVLRYRYELEGSRLAPATINLRLAAVRRLAYEASDNGLLNPDLAAGIRRVKGVKRLGMRLGHWLTADQGKKLLAVPASNSTRDKRDYAVLSLLLGCGLRRAELTWVTSSSVMGIGRSSISLVRAGTFERCLFRTGSSTGPVGHRRFHQ